MDEHAKQSALKWFIDFVNMDLDKLSLGDKMKLTTDAITIIYGMGPWLFGDRDEILMPYARWGDKKPIEIVVGEWLKSEKLKVCQDHIKDFFMDFMKNLKRAREKVTGGPKSLSKFTNFFLLGQFSIKNLNVRLETPIIPWENVKEKGDDDIIGEISDKALLESPINVAFKADNDADTLLFHFYMALWHSPLGSIRSCEECGKWFVHSTKRVKIFCSSQCAVRKANRERRQKIKKNDPKRYKKELVDGKKRAKKSYEKRIEKKLGRNVKVGK
jgi:hypothetical protein